MGYIQLGGTAGDRYKRFPKDHSSSVLGYHDFEVNVHTVLRGAEFFKFNF